MRRPQTAEQLMARNATEVAHAVSPAEQALALTERAMLMARGHHVHAAREALLEAETCGPFDELSLPSIHIELARAAVLYAEGRNPEAIEALGHALDASRHTHRPALQARALALLALLHLEPMDVGQVVRHAAGAAACGAHADAETRYRIGLAIGTAHGFAGDFAAAAQWFARAEADARETDSPYARAALGYAIARAAVTELRQRAMAGTLDQVTLDQGQVAMEWALQRLRHYVNPAALRAERILVAEMMCRAGDHDGARAELRAVLPEVMAQGPSALAAVGCSIEALCLLAAGNGAAALAAVERALSRLSTSLSDEVIGTVHADAARVLRGLHTPGQAVLQEALAAQAWQRVVESQRQIRLRLAAFPH